MMATRPLMVRPWWAHGLRGWGRGTGLAHCQECDSLIRVDYEATPHPVCRSCRSVQAVPTVTWVGDIDEPGLALAWDPAWDSEPVPDPPPKKKGGPGAARVLPTVEYEGRERCPTCDSDYTRSLGSNSGVRWYRDCLGCGQRYSYVKEATNG